ncbi:MAG: very short patch repair endonuclease [Muribaculaceae bacterium]|nr:very short patch repair endonuclease [Muribaculaceae bacterium]
MDIWSKEKRSQVMSRIRGRDTKPELIVRRYLYSRGYRFRKNVKGLPGTPDIVLRKYRVAIFVHGCFWHGHEVDGRIPDSNREFWQEKISRNKERDRRNKEKLLSMGWSVITVWECQLKPAARQRTLSGLEYYLNHNYLRLQKMKPAPRPYVQPCATQDDDSRLAAEPAADYGVSGDGI